MKHHAQLILFRWKSIAVKLGLFTLLFYLAAVSAIADSAEAGLPANNLPYPDEQLERFLTSLDLDSKIGALSLVQQGMAAVLQGVSVGIQRSEDSRVTSTILVFVSLRTATFDDVNLVNCTRANRSLMNYVLGGVWQEISSSARERQAIGDPDFGLPWYLQLARIAERMLGFVGTRQDTSHQKSFEEMNSELERYAPAYNALKFAIQLSYFDRSSAKLLSKQLCYSRSN
ncbi:MAG: hypothetical protein R3D05_05750 [Dongiaceae bacterium]